MSTTGGLQQSQPRASTPTIDPEHKHRCAHQRLTSPLHRATDQAGARPRCRYAAVAGMRRRRVNRSKGFRRSVGGSRIDAHDNFVASVRRCRSANGDRQRARPDQRPLGTRARPIADRQLRGVRQSRRDRRLREVDGVTVEITTITTSTEMAAKLLDQSTDVDLSHFLSPSAMSRYVPSRTIQPLNKSYLPNLANVLTAFNSPWYHVGALYTAPYTFYGTGIGFRADRIEAEQVAPGDCCQGRKSGARPPLHQLHPRQRRGREELPGTGAISRHSPSLMPTT